MERTTDLDKLVAGHAFTWGVVRGFHHVGEYTIVEANDWKVKGVQVLVGKVDEDAISFYCYIDGICSNRSTPSLDHALAWCIARKHDGENSQDATFFMRMIGAD